MVFHEPQLFKTVFFIMTTNTAQQPQKQSPCLFPLQEHVRFSHFFISTFTHRHPHRYFFPRTASNYPSETLPHRNLLGV